MALFASSPLISGVAWTNVTWHVNDVAGHKAVDGGWHEPRASIFRMDGRVQTRDNFQTPRHPCAVDQIGATQNIQKVSEITQMSWQQGPNICFNTGSQ